MRSGLLISESAIALACDLEQRGHVMQARDGKLIVSRGSELTAADRAGIVRERWHLLAIAGYEPEAPR